jgi:hypothetical protein
MLLSLPRLAKIPSQELRHPPQLEPQRVTHKSVGLHTRQPKIIKIFTSQQSIPSYRSSHGRRLRALIAILFLLDVLAHMSGLHSSLLTALERNLGPQSLRKLFRSAVILRMLVRIRPAGLMSMRYGIFSNHWVPAR